MVETSCEVVHYDRCGTFEIGCDGKEFSDGALLVKDDGSKTYKMRVTARNAYMVWDSCGLFSAFPSQGGDFEKVVEWSWNGPYAYARESSVDHRRQPKTHKSNDLGIAEEALPRRTFTVSPALRLWAYALKTDPGDA
jgi:hypothetical protein